MTELQEGDMAPNFTLPRSGGGDVTLSDFQGKEVVLFFYPQDDTSGCTKEACAFRDSHETIAATDAVVLGISPDGVDSHDRFIAKYNLPFDLLADTDHQVSEAYGTWAEKSMYGRKYMGIVRSTFLIDRDGRIKKIWRKVKPDRHVPDVLAELQPVTH